jgi:hypothetical protein
MVSELDVRRDLKFIRQEDLKFKKIPSSFFEKLLLEFHLQLEAPHLWFPFFGWQIRSTGVERILQMIPMSSITIMSPLVLPHLKFLQRNRTKSGQTQLQNEVAFVLRNSLQQHKTERKIRGEKRNFQTPRNDPEQPGLKKDVLYQLSESAPSQNFRTFLCRIFAQAAAQVMGSSPANLTNHQQTANNHHLVPSPKRASKNRLSRRKQRRGRRADTAEGGDRRAATNNEKSNGGGRAYDERSRGAEEKGTGRGPARHVGQGFFSPLSHFFALFRLAAESEGRRIILSVHVLRGGSILCCGVIRPCAVVGSPEMERFPYILVTVVCGCVDSLMITR